MSGTEIAFADLERRFLAIDETSARDLSSNRRLTSANAARSDRKPKGNQAKRKARANAAQLKGNGEPDLSKLKCFNCHAMGHYAL
jgi:cytochrome c5